MKDRIKEFIFLANNIPHLHYEKNQFRIPQRSYIYFIR